jgi:hypothetical protein
VSYDPTLTRGAGNVWRGTGCLGDAVAVPHAFLGPLLARAPRAHDMQTRRELLDVNKWLLFLGIARYLWRTFASKVGQKASHYTLDE